MDSFTKSIHIKADRSKIWNIVLNPNNHWGNAFCSEGVVAETDWKEGSRILWRGSDGDVVANGIVEVHQPEEYLQLHYYDEFEPKPDAALGNYYENIRLSEGDGDFVLSADIGKIEDCHVAMFEEMWGKALEMIKELAERE